MGYIEQIQNGVKELLPAMLLTGVAFVMIIVVYGVDNVASGVHDTFHDFRHSIGISCH